MGEIFQGILFDLETEPGPIVQLNKAVLQHPIVAHLAAGSMGPTNCAFWVNALCVTEGETVSVWRLDLGVAGLPIFDRR